jgi:hypothetical protein
MSALCAHPIAAIPLKRYGLPLSALIIGSMIPDGVYFIPLHPISEQFGHTLWGMISFCLPVGILAHWVFHAFIKLPAFSLLPASHQARVWPITSRQPSWSFSYGVRVLIALFVGALTHIIWDSCTHWYGWTVQHVPLLRIALFSTTHGTLRLYKVLQHGGTLVGTALLAWWYVAWLQTAVPSVVPSYITSSQRVKRLLVACLVGGAGFCGLMFGYVKVPVLQDLTAFRYFVVYTAKVAITTLIISFSMFSFGWHAFLYRRRKTQRL